MQEYVFGSGQLYATPTGSLTPLRVGTLQDVGVDFSGDIKELHGQFGFPVAVGRGKEKVAIKAGNGAIDIALYNGIFFGDAPAATGSMAQTLYPGEAASVPATSTYTITVANAMTFYADLGVVDVTSGATLASVSGSPATGEYAVDATTGVYTFNAAQASAAVLINYFYKDTDAGSTQTMTNHLIGTQPTFSLMLMNIFENNFYFCQFNKVIAGKLNTPLKLDDFMIADLEMSAFVDSTGTLGFWSTSV